MRGNSKLRDVSLVKRICSYVFPVKITKTTNALNPLLELYIFRGRWQLGTIDALYSDGVHYRPLVAAFAELKKVLPEVKKVLVLGTGLGSAVQILASKKYYPQYTLVDHDQQILEWAIELMDEGLLKYIIPVCDDANQYVFKNQEQFDLLIIDIFESRVVPYFVTEKLFLEQCRQCLVPGGNVVINYIIFNDTTWERDRNTFLSVFPGMKEIKLGINRVLIATV